MSTEQILGIKFFNGEVDEAVELMSDRGGFLVAPSGTCFTRLSRDESYRTAMINADVAIPDSGAMVLLWKLLRGETMNRISGWKYLSCLSAKLFADKSCGVLWVLPNETARKSTALWLAENGFPFSEDDFYLAPFYGPVVEDRSLVQKVDNQRPRHVVVGIGSGPQEKLGYYLREHLKCRPAIHCIGAALGFLTGEQVKIPAWGDRFYLGWLFRLFANPRRYLPRLWRAAELPWLLLRYGRNLPPLAAKAETRKL
jgi:exopolysaccharide biosynthesis WecB/TagA/CpsF family protein